MYLPYIFLVNIGTLKHPLFADSEFNDFEKAVMLGNPRPKYIFPLFLVRLIK